MYPVLPEVFFVFHFVEHFGFFDKHYGNFSQASSGSTENLFVFP